MRNPGIFLNDNTARGAGQSHLRMLRPDTAAAEREKKQYHEIEDRTQSVKSLIALYSLLS